MIHRNTNTGAQSKTDVSEAVVEAHKMQRKDGVEKLVQARKAAMQKAKAQRICPKSALPQPKAKAKAAPQPIAEYAQARMMSSGAHAWSYAGFSGLLQG